MEKSRLYESYYILRSDLQDEELKKSILDLKRKFDDLAIGIKKFEEIGVKNLAYAVKEHKQGYFISVEFRATPDELVELERYCRIKDDILKYCVLKKYNRRAN